MIALPHKKAVIVIGRTLRVMRKTFGLILLFLLGLNPLRAQEINGEVTIDAEKTGKLQLSIVRTLQNDLEDFINTTTWSERNLPQEHRVRVSFFITLDEYSTDNNEFEGSLQVQSSRPVYGSVMTTPVFNFKDEDFNFTYTENEPLAFNPNRVQSNLVSVLSFYIYTVLGLDADTFAPNGGASFFAEADQVANIAGQSGRSGWDSAAGLNSRYELNHQLRSSNFSDFHKALYYYHRKGLDVMHNDVRAGKENIVKAIGKLQNVHDTRPNTLLVRSFFDAKASEVARIFRGGPSVALGQLVSHLKSMAPAYNNQWNKVH